MKLVDWPKIQVNDYVIYADEYEGPFKYKILERDIRLYEPGTPSVWSYPYGLTDETGTVKILKDSVEMIVNLADCIKWTQNNFLRLEQSWKRYQTSLAAANSLKEDLIELISQLKES